jgi:hypothetical protein
MRLAGEHQGQRALTALFPKGTCNFLWKGNDWMAYGMAKIMYAETSSWFHGNQICFPNDIPDFGILLSRMLRKRRDAKTSLRPTGVHRHGTFFFRSEWQIQPDVDLLYEPRRLVPAPTVAGLFRLQYAVYCVHAHFVCVRSCSEIAALLSSGASPDWIAWILSRVL